MNRATARFIHSRLCAASEKHWSTSLICGSYRRGCEEIGDLDVLVIGDPVATAQALRTDRWRIIVAGAHLIRARKFQQQVDIMFTVEQCWGAAAMHMTGPRKLNIVQRMKAKEKGLRLSQWTVGRTEREVYRAFGWAFLSPKEREAEYGD